MIITFSAKFDNPLEKREQFAVSLRKQKKQEIIRQKRLKINRVSKGRDSNGEGQGGEQDLVLNDEEMESYAYYGYPAWRKDKYKAMHEILSKILGDQDWFKDKYEPLNLVSCGG
jgi:hypothetical protein